MRIVRSIYNQFWLNNLEARVMSHPAAREFSGERILLDGRNLDVFRLNSLGIELYKEDFARLFLLPNDSIAGQFFKHTSSIDEAPPGFYILNKHRYIEAPHVNSVGLYREQGSRQGVFLEGVFIDHIFFDDLKAPNRLTTAGIVFLAITAFRMGFSEITLLAGGGAPGMGNWRIPDMIGYLFWPKFGFDAPLEHGEVDAVPHLSRCKTVQDIRKTDLTWWEKIGGNGRVMRFDLRTHSKSWRIMLNYIYTHKEFS